MNLKEVKKLNIPKKPGSYQFFDFKNKIIYVGKAVNLKSRVVSYWQKSTNHSPAKHSMVKQIKKVEWVETDTEIEALLLEANLIKKYQPQFNILKRDDKRFQYIKLSIDDEVPGVFSARKLGKSGKYYGPFTSGTAVKETIKAIRKIWPYCTEKKLSKKPCFYFQVNRCTGVCGGVISREEYLNKIIKPIGLFLDGKKGRIILSQEAKIRNKEKLIKKIQKKGGDVEREIIELKRIKFELFNMKNVLEHTHIISKADKFKADVVELAKLIDLPRVPCRIEGYDISNIFNQDAVASMVVFQDGEPNKGEYKKFKIKVSENTGDTGMLREVLTRRLAHSPQMRNDSQKVKSSKLSANSLIWPDPDLIIVDGGKGQLNAALKVLKKTKLDVPVIAISKGRGLRSAGAPDKLFFPGEKKPLELSLSSPVLHLIKRVRDEAHRFAIKYHRSLKRKRMLK